MPSSGLQAYVQAEHYKHNKYIFKKKITDLENENKYEETVYESIFWAGEMTQQVRALTALPKVVSSIPSNHMVAHNHLQWDPMSLLLCLKTATVYSCK